MRVLGITETCDLGALYMALVAEGHEVRVSISDPLAQGTLAGLVEHVEDWRSELPWIREAGEDGLLLFEAVSEGFGALQDELRREGLRVVGGSTFGDRLENDRAYAQDLLASLGLQTAGVHTFPSAEAALAFLDDHPGRYVLKYNGAAGSTYVGQLADGGDVRALLASHANDPPDHPVGMILMDLLEGIEMGVGAYFNGERFLLPACLDWEHKRFFPGDMGELTGEMGTVATFARSRRFFELTLARLAPHLRAHRHVGYVNLNTIVNEDGIWPLEFTCRFGYPGFAVLAPLQATGWAELLRAMAGQSGEHFEVRPGFSVGVVITTPPFPYSRKEVDAPVGLPILVPPSLLESGHLHFGELGMTGGRLVTSGLYGWTMVVTGIGADVESARRDAYARAAGIIVPDGRYRLDIGERLRDGELARLEALGLLAD